jgi:hypothetical protein
MRKLPVLFPETRSLQGTVRFKGSYLLLQHWGTVVILRSNQATTFPDVILHSP